MSLAAVGAAQGPSTGVVEGDVMRRLIATLILTGGAAVVTPLAASPAADTGSPRMEHQAAVQQVTASLPALGDEAAMVLVGTALIGLGAAVRRAL